MSLVVEGRALRPLSELLELTELPLAELLPAATVDQIFADLRQTDARVYQDGENTVVEAVLVFEGELALEPPGLAGFALVLGEAGQNVTAVAIQVVIGPGAGMRLRDLTVGLRVPEGVLRDVATNGPATIRVGADLFIGPGGPVIEQLHGASLDRAWVAGTELVVSGEDLELVIGPVPPPHYAPGSDFQGLAAASLRLELPAEWLSLDPGADLAITLSEVTVGLTGFSGGVELAAADLEQPVGGALLGFPFRFRELAVDIEENVPQEMRIGADLRLMPFERPGVETWIGVDVRVAQDGSMTAALAALQPPEASSDPAALVELVFPDVIRFLVSDVALASQAGVWSLQFGGEAALLVPGPVTWPRVGFDQLGADSQGNLLLGPDGIELLTPMVAELAPLRLTLTSGALTRLADQSQRLQLDLALELELLQALPVTLSAELLRIRWRPDLTEPPSLCLVGLELDAHPVEVSVAEAAFELLSGDEGDGLRVHLGGAELGPLGTVSALDLVAVERATPEGPERRFRLETTLLWQEVEARLTLPDLPLAPVATAAVKIVVDWREVATGWAVHLVLEAELEDPAESLWGFVPPEMRPEVAEAAFGLDITYSDGDDFAAGSVPADDAIEFFVRLRARLPELPELPGVTVEAGDEEGWVVVRSAVAVAEAGASLGLTVEGQLVMNIEPPGLALETAPFVFVTEMLEAELGAAGGASGHLRLAGALELQPFEAPPALPVATHLQELFSGFETDGLAGSGEVELAFAGDRVALSMAVDLEELGLEVRLLEVLANLAVGRGAGAEPGDSVALAGDPRIELSRITLALGSLEPDDDPLGFQLEVIAKADIGGFGGEIVLAFSDEELALAVRGEELEDQPGWWTSDIPLRLPSMGVRASDIAALDASGWDLAALEAERRAAIESELGIADLAASEERAAVEARGGLAAGMFLLAGIAELREGLSPGGRQVFSEVWLTGFFGLIEQAEVAGTMLGDARLRLEDIKLRLPFGDPRSLGVEGRVRILGFAESGQPLEALEGTSLALGISADLIYFELEALGTPIELPPIGPYDGASVALSQFRLGYGYTSNSFNVLLRGAVTLPDQLVADGDTSATLGVGVRAPTHTSIYFRLGLIPIPGPIPAVPVFDFNLDLRRPDSLPLVDAEKCIPYWDGLRFHAPGWLEADLKHVAFAPLFGPLPMPNVRLDLDQRVGDDLNGATVIVDDLLLLAGLAVSASNVVPIAFFADPGYPYFENLCINLRLAGFRVNFRVQRPFPTFSPFLLFELMALLSDPEGPIDPDGDLAGLFRVTLSDVSIAIPEWAGRLCPDLGEAAGKHAPVSISLGTFMPAIQQGIGWSRRAIDSLGEVAGDIEAGIERLARTSLEIDPDALLRVLPPEARKLRTGASLGGFDARAVLLLMSPAEALAELERRDAPPAATTRSAPGWGESADPQDPGVLIPSVARPARGERVYDVADASENLFLGMELQGFDAEDMAAVPASATPGVVLAAHVKVLDGQRFRFLGHLLQDGTFSLRSRLERRPLRLAVAGVEVPVPLAFDGRMELDGRVRRDGVRARVRAFGHAEWEPLPGLLRLSIGDAKDPARLALWGDGRFRLRAPVTMAIAAASLDGAIEASRSHCLVSGAFDYRVPAGADPDDALLRLDAEVAGRIGPGPRFELRGEGAASFLGVVMGQVRCRLDGHTASVSGAFGPADLRFLDVGMPVTAAGEVSGTVDLRKTLRPAFDLAGTGTLGFLDAEAKGRARFLTTKKGALRARAEGSLSWAGHRWLRGALEVNGPALRLEGQTSFSVPLTHPGTGDTELAHLFLRLDLDAALDLDVAGGLADYEVDVSCLLGIRLPNKAAATGPQQGHYQFIPLAAHQRAFEGPGGLDRELLQVRGLHVPGVSDVPSITIPLISLSESTDVDTLSLDGFLPVPWFDAMGDPEEDWGVPPGYTREDLLTIPLPAWNGSETIEFGGDLTDLIRVRLTYRDARLRLEIDAGGEIVEVPIAG